MRIKMATGTVVTCYAKASYDTHPFTWQDDQHRKTIYLIEGTGASRISFLRENLDNFEVEYMDHSKVSEDLELSRVFTWISGGIDITNETNKELLKTIKLKEDEF